MFSWHNFSIIKKKICPISLDTFNIGVYVNGKKNPLIALKYARVLANLHKANISDKSKSLLQPLFLEQIMQFQYRNVLFAELQDLVHLKNSKKIII